MAERRMFAKTIVLSDAFLDMPLGARCLYMTMGMLADDDGFVNSPKSIIRQCGATEDDMRILFAKKFVIPFESGVVVIKHWRINNYLQSDRYKETVYLEEKSQLVTNDKGAYSLQDNQCIQNVYTGQSSIGKDSIGKDIDRGGKFVKPTLEEVKDYFTEKGKPNEAENFYDYYEGNGWKVGKNKMQKWKAVASRWCRNADNYKPQNRVPDFVNQNSVERKEVKSEAFDELLKEFNKEFEND